MTNSSDLKAKNSDNRPMVNLKTRIQQILCGIAVGSLLTVFPGVAFASVESSLQAVQDKLVGTLLPLAAMCGMVVAGLSFVAGHPNARQHLIYAIVGAIVGFGAESIVSLIRSLIH
jgi:type IV secretory pathway VirB2 component (pilin)